MRSVLKFVGEVTATASVMLIILTPEWQRKAILAFKLGNSMNLFWELLTFL